MTDRITCNLYVTPEDESKRKYKNVESKLVISDSMINKMSKEEIDKLLRNMPNKLVGIGKVCALLIDSNASLSDVNKTYLMASGFKNPVSISATGDRGIASYFMF